VNLGYKPNPRQMEFFRARARHIGYGGARGGGKSWAMRTKFALLASRYKELNLLLMRRTLTELTENHVNPLLKTLAGYVDFNKSERVFLFPNGSRIKLGYCDNENDVYRYQGQEYDVIGLEEATTFTESQAQFISTCNRSIRTDFTPRMYYTCNPGGVGHSWVKRLFITCRYKNSERAEDYAFIPARVTDNQVLMNANPEYIQVLKNLPEHLRRAHLEGDWDALAGQFFEEFRRDMHVIRPMDIPKEWRRFRSIDWGYADPCATLWFAVAPSGRVIVYRERYKNKTLAKDVAKEIRALSEGEKITYTAASPDMWQERGNTDIAGTTLAETFSISGVPLIRADNTRSSGWQRVRDFLAPMDDGFPRMLIFSTCENLIRTLPEMMYDDHFVEDVADGLEDHAPEALRYGLMSRPAPNIITLPPEPKPFDPLARNKPRGNGFYSQ